MSEKLEVTIKFYCQRCGYSHEVDPSDYTNFGVVEILEKEHLCPRCAEREEEEVTS